MNSDSPFEVLVVGAGPAGIAAAARAAECGARTGIVDDNTAPGGQIWRGDGGDHPEGLQWKDRLRNSGATVLGGFRVFHQPEAGVLLAESPEQLRELRYRKLILATGARERFLPFPGWTLPNVTGAGGLQAMVKSGLPIRGKRVVVAGTGPLLLAVAANLRRRGAAVLIICEQASWSRLVLFGTALFGFPGKVRQGLQLRRELREIPFAASSWVVAAHGRHSLRSVTISRAGKLQQITCDYLACGFHLVPNVELATLLGCSIHGGCVHVNDFQETSVTGIFCAGEPTGIGGVELALVEGQIAGLAAAGQASDASKLFGERDRARRFASLLDRTSQLRTELKRLAGDDTMVCRCEDVPLSRLQMYGSWRAAKLHTRCGMGPCQGRVCGAAAEFLFGWKTESVRPPVFPARLQSLAGIATDKPETIGE